MIDWRSRLSGLLAIVLLTMPAALAVHASVHHHPHDPVDHHHESASHAKAHDQVQPQHDLDAHCDLCDLLHVSGTLLDTSTASQVAREAPVAASMTFPEAVRVRAPPVHDKQSRAPPARV